MLRVREIRKDRKMSQYELAKRVGVAQGYISDIESGKGTPSLDVFFRLADALNCDLEELSGRNIILPEAG